MTIYRITYDTRIEATVAYQAAEILMENNGSASEEYFLDLEAASARFAEIKSQLRAPHDLGHHAGKQLFWFEGVCLEAGYDCGEPDEDDDLRDAFQTAARWDVEEVFVRD